jgi:hypothetical protein
MSDDSTTQCLVFIVPRTFSQACSGPLRSAKGEFRRRSPAAEGRRSASGQLEDDPRKGKGCDIGYALAASSCEGANSVEACTVTALDAITAFAVPNPNCPSQSRRFFQVWLPSGLPRRADHSAYFGLAKV